MPVKKIMRVLLTLILQILITNTAISKSLMDTLPPAIQRCINAADEAAIAAEKFKGKRDLQDAINRIRSVRLPPSETDRLLGFLVILHLTDPKDIDSSAIRTQYYLSCVSQN
jgi:hypothetical protein